jgi:MFS family permease
MFLGAGSVGIAELLLAPVRTTALAGVLLFVCGIAFTSYTANSNASIQLASPDYIRGRVLGLYYYGWNGIAPVGALLVGWMCDRGGTELAFLVGGLCALVMTLAGATFVKNGPRKARRARLQAEPVGEQLAA